MQGLSTSAIAETTGFDPKVKQMGRFLLFVDWQGACVGHVAPLVPSVNPIRRSANMSAAAFLSPNLVCLQRAVLCADCEIISEGNNGHCAACGSEAVLSLSKVLGGPLESELATKPCATIVVGRDVFRASHHSAAA